VSELGHLAGLAVECVRLGVLAEALAMPDVAELGYDVVIHLHELGAASRDRAGVMEHEDQRSRYPLPWAVSDAHEAEQGFPAEQT